MATINLVAHFWALEGHTSVRSFRWWPASFELSTLTEHFAPSYPLRKTETLLSDVQNQTISWSNVSKFRAAETSNQKYTSLEYDFMFYAAKPAEKRVSFLC